MVFLFPPQERLVVEGLVLFQILDYNCSAAEEFPPFLPSPTSVLRVLTAKDFFYASFRRSLEEGRRTLPPFIPLIIRTCLFLPHSLRCGRVLMVEMSIASLLPQTQRKQSRQLLFEGFVSFLPSSGGMVLPLLLECVLGGRSPSFFFPFRS